jgi:hypothetical protein
MVLEHALRRWLKTDDSSQPQPSWQPFVEESMRRLPNAEEIFQCEVLIRNYAQASSSMTKAAFEKGDISSIIGCCETYFQNIQSKLEQFQWLEDEYLHLAQIRRSVSSQSRRATLVEAMRTEVQAARSVQLSWNEQGAIRLPALIQHLLAACNTADPHASSSRESILIQQQQFMEATQTFEQLLWLSETVVGVYDSLRGIDSIMEVTHIQAVDGFEAAVAHLSEVVSQISREQVGDLPPRFGAPSSARRYVVEPFVSLAGGLRDHPDGARREAAARAIAAS